MKSQFAFLFVAVMTLVVLSSSLSWLISTSTFDEQTKQHEVQYVKSLSRMSLRTLLPYLNEKVRYGDIEALERHMQTIANQEKLSVLTLFDDAFKPVVSVSGIQQQSLPVQNSLPDNLSPSQLGIFFTEGNVQAIVRIGSRDYPRGYIGFTLQREAIFPGSHHHLSKMAWLIQTAVLCVLLVLSFFIIRWLLKPVGLFNRFMNRVNDTKDYALRLEPPSASEFRLLGERINKLLATIEIELSINSEQNQTLAEQQETMTRLANFDSLTSLPNRQYIMDNLRQELSRAQRNKQELALLFFDLDGFKGINDSLGHETGDQILIEVADRVSGLLRSGDVVARLGGDEFVVLPNNETSDASLQNMADRLILAFDAPFQLRGLSLQVGVSIGIAKASDADYDLSKLMSNADLAMYRSKAQGRGRYTVFTPDMVLAYKRKMAIAKGIDAALSNDDFMVFYQPKIDQHGKVVGLEALIRWQHAEMGMIMPNEFIEVAEQGGKISSVTRYVIKKVCQELPQLIDWSGDKIRVAINLSAHDLRDNRLFDFIHSAFNEYQVNPEMIEFEVTESAYLDNFELSNKFFRRLSNMGCFVSLDDFGTGYSSLSYLTQISIDALKVDRQFVKDLDSSERNRTVTGAIIDLAKRLSLSVCAEGVEFMFQWDYLIGQGCDEVQGFMFSKPVPLATLVTLPTHYQRALLESAQQSSE